MRKLAAISVLFACSMSAAFASDDTGDWVTNDYFRAEVASGKGRYVNGAWTMNPPSLGETSFAIDSTQTVFRVAGDAPSESNSLVRIVCDLNLTDYASYEELVSAETSVIASLALVTNETAGASAFWMAVRNGDTWVRVAPATPVTALGNYAVRIELDYSSLPQPLVRYSISNETLRGWTVLKEDGSEWLTLAEDSPRLDEVRFSGQTTLTSLDAKFSTACPVEPESTGPIPESDSGVEIVPAAGWPDGTYAVESIGDSKTIAVTGAKTSDRLVVAAQGESGVEEIEGVAASQVKIVQKVVANGREHDIGAAFKAVDVGSAQAPAARIVLDGASRVKLTVGAKEVEIPVQPTIGATIDGIEIAQPFVAGDEPSATIATIPGLTYQLKRDTDPAGDCATGVSARTPATAETLTLSDTSADKPADKAFYTIEVTK